MAAVARDVGRLRVRDLSFRYLIETGEADADGWRAEVETTWRLAGFDPTAARAEIEVGFADGGAAVADLAGQPRLSPLWMSGSLTVHRAADTLVLVEAEAADGRTLARQARRGLGVVRDVLGRGGRLVVEVPASPASLNAAVGADAGTYDRIAAVTAAADGSGVPDAPVHVFLNPEVYGGLDPLAAQVVMSHEAVHAVTGAPASVQTAPPWLLEGFADYVALRDVGLPETTTAAQVAEQVRTDGVPGELPGPLEFRTGGANLGAAYEAAWLVCVTLVEHGGEEALVALYDAALAGAPVEEQLRRRFGWSLTDLTRAWQDRLRAVARAGG
ncbi:hypothetical protein [Nocardioides sp. TF02-7]|uniref:hypothetical protein n=1 Tax=Nocardioides sp. TF02-7 TaxID=2917724 RepID=UPI001F06F693|nr:hypothetical protein [Nocardioides sp. TF02-7]UMG92052.1 hypothetical protein MF408_19075 [Nocardioides sp. TF02-7]